MLPYHTITALIPLRFEKSSLAEIVIIWLTYRICSPISKSIFFSSFFYWCLSMIVSVVFYYLESFVAFYHLFFVRCFVFSDNLDFCQMPNGFLNKTYKKKVQNRKVTYHRILHIRNSLGIKFQRQNYKFLDQINPKRVLPIQKWKKRKSRSNFTYSN